jgi:hypothetical protein
VIAVGAVDYSDIRWYYSNYRGIGQSGCWRTDNQARENKKLFEIGTAHCPECNSRNVQSLDL